MLHKFNLPKYLDDKDSDFNDFESVASENVKNYEGKYKSMMRNEYKSKDKIKFQIHKKQGFIASGSTSPITS